MSNSTPWHEKPEPREVLTEDFTRRGRARTSLGDLTFCTHTHTSPEPWLGEGEAILSFQRVGTCEAAAKQRIRRLASARSAEDPS